MLWLVNWMPLCSRTGHRAIRLHISLGFAKQDHKGRVSVPVIVVLQKCTGTTELGFAQYRRNRAVVSGSARGQRRPSVRTADSSMATRRPRGHGTTYGQNRTVPVRAGRSTTFTARAEMCPTPVPTMGGRARSPCPPPCTTRCTFSTTSHWTGYYEPIPPEARGWGWVERKTAGGASRARGPADPATPEQEPLIFPAFEAGLNTVLIARVCRKALRQVYR